ncbi:MAG: response regulator [Methanospirillum sp.]|nr:response regulator [Methanospirillum sp.]
MTDEPIRVLHIDDHCLWRSAVADHLSLLDTYLIRSVESGESAIQILKKEQFDVIVSDYEMPGMNGIQVLKQVQSLRLDIPFILFTGMNSPELIREAKEYGADFCLHKCGIPERVFHELHDRIHLAINRRAGRYNNAVSDGH